MARSLDVYLHEEPVGRLVQDDGGQMSFEYLESWLAKPDAVVLSQSLPLRKERFPARECRGFFGGLLPEESKREIIARNLGISARNDYAMLEQIGGECSGAVTFIPEGQQPPERAYHYRKLDAKELAGILRDLPKRPLLAGEKGIRLSLAGAQDKVAVRIEGEEVSLPLGSAPSTHILKPAVERFAGVVSNEALCVTLAAHMNLPAAKVEIRRVEGVEYLLVERYDRKHVTVDGALTVERLHQEDFCQATATPPGRATKSSVMALGRSVKRRAIRMTSPERDADTPRRPGCVSDRRSREIDGQRKHGGIEEE
jgi:serine/threonine-protein kinase HipA